MKEWGKLPEDLKVGQLVCANGTMYKVVKQTNKDTCNNTKKQTLWKSIKLDKSLLLRGRNAEWQNSQ